jgi:sarcosine oxidase
MIDARGGNVHPLDLVRSLARAAVAAGASIHPRTSVRSLSRAGDRWRLDCQNGSVLAGEVVVATNGYSDALVPGLLRSVLPVNSFQIATAPLPTDMRDRILPGGHAAFDSRRLILYLRKSPDGRVVLGGRASFSSHRDLSRQRRDYDVLRAVLVGIFPELREVEIDYRWTGLVCITPDFIPHYHNPVSGLHVLLGFNGKGVALSTRAGAWLARKIAGEPESCEIPATPIKPVPLHAFRAPFAHLIMQWHHVMDLVGR